VTGRSNDRFIRSPTLSPPVSKPRRSTMPPARWRALSPKRVAQPEAERPLILPGLTRRRDRLGEVRGDVLALQDRLPGNPDRRRCFPNGAAFFQFPKDQSAAPIKFHGLRLPETRLAVHRGRLGAGNGTTMAETVVTDWLQIFAPYSCILARFGAFEHLFRLV
jgi:hypothetical protein